MKEAIGYIMVNPEMGYGYEDDGSFLTGASFLPVKEVDGKAVPLSPKEAEAMRGIGLRPVALVKTEAIYHGSKVTHSGYEVYLKAGLTPAEMNIMNRITPALVEEMLEGFYSKLPSSVKTKVEEA